MTEFRAKPVRVDAALFTGFNYWADICPLVGRHSHIHGGRVFVRTSRGAVEVLPGEYVVVDDRGEIFTCASGVFADRYEAV